MSSTPEPTRPASPEPDEVEVEEGTSATVDAAADEAPEDGAVDHESETQDQTQDETQSETDVDEPTGSEGRAESTSQPEESDAPGPSEPSKHGDQDEPALVGRPAVRARLRQVFVKPGRSQIVVGALLAALGFAAVTQVRSTQLDDSYQGRREEELIEIFNGVAGTSDRTRKEIARLEQDRRELQVDTSARQAAVEQAEARLKTLNMLAGLVPVTGPGLRITITEEAGRISIDSLLDTIQELRTAGAEAIEFDGRVRLVVSSSFSDVDGVIHLDGEPLRSPYVIEVIGEPHTLHTGLTFPSGPIATLRGDESADVSIEELDSVDVESIRSLPRAEFATPAEGQ
ncbi:DUF881 domain-containing protein [Nocardioides daphniae]|uniref:DUF881 domain-containing protein n=1 Tax=Nocardioides daphniae TaxID=402297 RepID=A0A4P7UC53_9ACTN|nr:DUF881 domain-containing protein [Nocardioides daphniae]QCC77334.1 DUF881 domain-containing protein [Nocardioides daphniae]GGD25170.1 hypothetical protein GCM10007231_25580 [Nocardioides daphniae]